MPRFAPRKTFRRDGKRDEFPRKSGRSAERRVLLSVGVDAEGPVGRTRASTMHDVGA